MQVHSSFDRVRRLRLLPVDEDAISLQQQLFQQIRLVLLHLNDLLREHLARGSPRVVHVRVPQLQHRLSSEPAVADEQAVNDTAAVVFSPSRLCGQDYFPCNHG